MSTKKSLALVPILVMAGYGIAGAQQGTNSLSSLAPSPPIQQSIRYVDKKPDMTDFRGLGQHLIYFPAFNMPGPVTGLRTDCGDLDGDPEESGNNQGCIIDTPDFENFKHNLGWEFGDRTFSPDAGGDPIGVKAAGGYSGWDVITIPTDSSNPSVGISGLSGTVYDTNACNNSSDIVNQIRINTDSLHEFCLNIIVDNAPLSYQPDSFLEARSDTVNVKLMSADPEHRDDEGNPAPWPEENFKFDGSTDMYTFRYMGMKKGDRIKIRLRSDHPFGDGCSGVGFGGIMVSDISTCAPAPGTCTPDCADRVCGDDGCGGSCGICPRVDKLVHRIGTTDVEIPQPSGPPLTNSATDVETALSLNTTFAEIIDKMESEVRSELKPKIKEKIKNGLRFRNFHVKVRERFRVTQIKGSTPSSPTSVDYHFPNIHASFKLKLPSDPFHLVKYGVDIDIRDIHVVGSYDVNGNLIPLLGPNGEPLLDSEGHYVNPFTLTIGHLETEVDNESWLALLFPLLPLEIQPLFLAVLGPFGDLILDYIGLGNSGGTADLFGSYMDILLTDKLRETLHEKLPEITNDRLTTITIPSLAVLPTQIEIGGVNVAPQFRDAILNPPPNGIIELLYDGTSPTVLSGNDPVKSTLISTVELTMWNQWEAKAGLVETVFPEIIGSIDAPYYNSGGLYTVDGWVCSEGLGMSLDTGVFSDGSAMKLSRADLPSDIAVAYACGTGTNGFNAYRYSMSLTEPELSSVTAWDNEITVQAGLAVTGAVGNDPIAFEKGLGEVSRAGVKMWLSDDSLPNNAHVNPGAEHIGDFNGDQRDDYMWFLNGWWVALANANGNGFNQPSIWLAANAVPNNLAYHSGFEFVADFNNDGRDDYMWFRNGWRVALANPNGTGFLAPTVWLADNAAPNFQHWNGDSQHIGDFNFDGRTDYMWYRNSDGWYVALAKTDATGFQPPTRWLASNAVPENGTDGGGDFEFVDDFNGDGRDDYMFWNNGSGWRVALANYPGTAFETPEVWLADNALPNNGEFGHTNSLSQHVGEFNGDGRADYMWFKGPDGWWVALANTTGDGFMEPTIWLSAKAVPNIKSYHTGFEFIADFNNDLVDDFMWFRNGWRVALANSNGTSFEAPVMWLDDDLLAGIPVWTNYSQHVGDYNGDGSADYLWYKEVGGSSSNSGLRVARTLLSPPPPTPPGGGC